MATVTSTKTAAKPGIGPGWPKPPGKNGSNGNGHKRFGRKRFSKDTYRITVWILMAAIVMMFVALASSYIILSGNKEWQPVRMPKAFIFSTGLILFSSVTITAARRRSREGRRGPYRIWLLVTLLLGLGFLGSQVRGWQQLFGAGAFISGNPHSSFYYLFTGAHGLHLLGGLMALTYLALRSGQSLTGEAQDKRSAAIDAVTLYWHFMDGLWVGLFLLLRLWK